MATDNTRAEAASIVTWRGPEGIDVVLDEDGVSLRIPASMQALEPSSVDKLFKIVATAKTVEIRGTVGTPIRPTRDEIRGMTYDNQSTVIARAAIRAIRDEVSPAAIQF